MKPARKSRAGLGALWISAIASCSAPPAGPQQTERIPPTVSPVTPGDSTPQNPAFEAASPATAAAKIKDLLTGLPPTAEEVQAITPADGAKGIDRQALAGLIDTWMQSPQFRDTMLGFFRNAFQQNQVLPEAMLDQLPSGVPNTMLFQNLQDSFPLTAWQIVSEGRPFHETLTTQRFMMTPALAALYGYMDNLHVDDKAKQTGQLVRDWPGTHQGAPFSFNVTRYPVPLEETLDPASENYLWWNIPAPLPNTATPECVADPRTYDRNTAALWSFLFGSLVANTAQASPGPCLQSFTVAPKITDPDYTTWRPVTLRQPRPGESPTPFFDLLAMRNANELVFRVPRQGFFTTPAFFANWQTNTSNVARVTMNQSLIVALGSSFDGADNTVPVIDVGLDAQHAGPGTPCYSCHVTLDPMRQTLRQAFTLAYHEQVDPAQLKAGGVFTFAGVSKPLADLADLAGTLAQHPRFAVAWTGKLCNWATSTPCQEDDPELLRVAEAFKTSGYDFKALVREMLSSPLVTTAADTLTFQQQGVTISIARRDQICTALGNRLGFTDPCGLSNSPKLTVTQKKFQGYAVMIPSDGYSRGAEHQVLSNDPNLFFRATTEDLCQLFADLMVDAAGAQRYSSANAEPVLDDLVKTVMGLPASDPRAGAARTILSGHFADARKAGSTTTDALKSTFTLACMSPGSVALGL